MVKEQHPTTCCIFPFAPIDIPSYSSRLPPEAPNIKRLTPPLNTQIRDLARWKSYIRRTTTPLLQNSTPIPHKRLTSSAWAESDRVYREALLGVLAQKMIESKREQGTFISYYFRGHQSGGDCRWRQGRSEFTLNKIRRVKKHEVTSYHKSSQRVMVTRDEKLW